MIVTQQKDPRQILRMLTGAEKIFLVGCGDCAAACRTGGEEEIKQMAKFLAEEGKTVTGTAVPDATCVSAQVKALFVRHRAAIVASDAILVLACGSGIQCIQVNDRRKMDVYPGCDSLFSAVVDGKGSFQEFCSSCGECLLALTEGICPVTRCSKALLNGPCGGQKAGKCEADKDRECAWVLIYERLKEKNRLARMKECRPARDFRKASRPHPPMTPGGQGALEN